jgi:ferredoxin
MAKIDGGKCIGCGLCADLCPKVFYMNDRGQAVVVSGQEKNIDETVKNAASACPAAAISLK